MGESGRGLMCHLGVQTPHSDQRGSVGPPVQAAALLGEWDGGPSPRPPRLCSRGSPGPGRTPPTG